MVPLVGRSEFSHSRRWRPDYDLCRALLTHAVRKRLMSDVEVGTFLSGGIDSSIVTALAAREVPTLRAFTVGMEGSPDLEMARRAADYLGIERVVKTFTVDDIRRSTCSGTTRS